MGDKRREFVAESLWLLIGVVTLPLAALASIAGIPFGSEVVAIIGWFLLAPIFLFWGEEIATILYGPETDTEADADAEADPVEILKRRYARGEIDEEEFEARLNRLLDVDGVLGEETAEAERADIELQTD